MKRFLLSLVLSCVGILAWSQVTCTYTLELEDSFGNGWPASTMSVTINGNPIAGSPFQVPSGQSSLTVPITANDGDALVLDYTATGIETGDNSYTLTDAEGILLIDSGFNPQSQTYPLTFNCPTCPAVSNVMASAESSSELRVSWTNGGNETEWILRYGPPGFNVDDPSAGQTQTGVTNNPYILGGLSSETTYDVYVIPVCGPNDEGTRQGPGTATTLESCPDPSNLTLYDQTADEIAFYWDRNGNTSSDWEVEYGVAPYALGGGGTTVTGSTAALARITGLTSNTCYDFYLRIDCGGGDFSDWAGPFNQCTFQTCTNIAGLNVINIDRNSAELSWVAVGSETEWEVSYGPAPLDPATSITTSVTNTNPTFTGLQSQTDYEFCVTAICSSTDQSNPVCTSATTESDYCGPDNLVDSGGSTGNYDSDENITYTICPDNPGDVVNINFTEFLVEPNFAGTACDDALVIYDGDNVNAPIIQTPSGDNEWCWDGSEGTGDLVGVPLTGSLPSGCLTFVFTSDGFTELAGFEATVSCIPPPTCPNPTNLSVSNITDSAADLDWNVGGSETQWAIEYGPTPFTPTGTATEIINSPAPYTIQGPLLPATQYDVFIRAVCGPNDESVNVGPATFVTLPGAPDGVVCPSNNELIVYSEGFNNQAPQWTGTRGTTGTGQWEFSSAGTGSTGTGPTGPFEGSEYVYFDTSGTNTAGPYHLTSPAIDLSQATDDAELSFYFYSFGGDQTIFEVSISPDNTTFTTIFTYVGPLQASDTEPWAPVGVDIPSSFLGGDLYVRLSATEEPGGETGFVGDVAIDLLEITTCSDQCLPPSSLQATNVTEDSADISWVGPNANSYDYEYGAPGFTPGTGAQIGGATGVANTSANLTMLTSATQYEVYVRSNCVNSTTTAWAGPLVFTTNLSAPDGVTCPQNNAGYIYTENFDTQAPGWTGTRGTTGSGQWEFSGAGTGSTGTGPTGPFEGSEYMYFDTSGTNTAGPYHITSPAINLSQATDDIEISFYFFAFGTAPAGQTIFDVSVSSDNTNFTNVFSYVGQFQNSQSDPWELIGIDIPASFTGGDLYIRFSATEEAGNETNFRGDVAVDFLRVETCADICADPSDITVSNVTDSSADIAWTENGNSTTWEVAVQPDGTGTPAGSGTSTTNNPYSATGLSSGTAYEVFLRADCGGGSFSNWIGPVDFTTSPDYCAGDQIVDTGGTTGQYSNNENITYVVCPDNPGDVVSVDFTVFEVEYNTDTSCWDSMTVYNGDNTNASTINPPAGGTEWCWSSTDGSGTGDLTATTLDATNASGCLTFVFESDGSFTEDGYVADVTCSPGPACSAPTNVVVDMITGSSAEVSFTDTAGAPEWTIYYGPAGYSPFDGPAATVVGPVTSQTANPLTGLAGDTDYDVYVVANCGPNDNSFAAGPVSFSTTADYCGSTQIIDSGGPNGDYSNNEFTDYLIQPNNPGDVVTILFSEFDVEESGTGCFDSITIYDGVDDTAPAFQTPAGGTEWCWDPANNSGTGNLVGVPITATNPAGALYIVFESDPSFTEPGYIADVTCGPPPTCPQPSNVVVSNVRDVLFDLDFTENGSATMWEYVIVAPSAAPSSGTPQPISATDVDDIGGVVANTDYEVYVRAVCAANDLSNWTGPVAFTTTDPLPPSPDGVNCPNMDDIFAFEDDFETENTDWTGDVITVTSGNGWYFGRSGTTPSGSTGPFGADSGSGYLYYEASGTNSSVFSIVSPAIDLRQATDEAELSFAYHHYVDQPGSNITVEVTSDPVNGPFDVLFTRSGPLQTDENDPWVQVGVDIPASYLGQIIYIRLSANEDANNQSFAGDIAIDNMKVETCGDVCRPPADLTVFGIGPGSAFVSFTELANATNWEITYFETASGGTPDDPNNPRINTTTTTGTRIDMLNSATQYSVFVRADCGGGFFSTWTGPVNFFTNLLPRQGVDCGADDSFFAFVDSFEDDSKWIGNIDNGNGSWNFGAAGLTPTGDTGPSAAGEGGTYLYYESSGTNGTPSSITTEAIDLTNATNAIELSFLYHLYGVDNTQLDISISTNPNTGFVNIFSFGGILQSDETSPFVSVGVDVPNTYLGEIVYLRLTATDDPNPVDGAEGDLAIDGLKLQSCGQLCFPPEDLTINNITDDSAFFEWNDGALRPSIGYEYVIVPRDDPRPTGAGTPVTPTNVTLDNLTPVTEYDVYVRAECSPGIFSPYAGPVQFVTDCPLFVAPYGQFQGQPGNGFEPFPGPCWEEGADTPVAVGPQGGNSLWRQDEFANDPTSPYGLSARINIYGDFTFQEWLVSPTIDLGTSGNFYASFNIALVDYDNIVPPAAQTSLGSDDVVQFLISEDGGNTWTVLQTWDSTTPISPENQLEGVLLDNYTGEVKFAFWANNGNVDDPQDVNFYVDNFTVDTNFSTATPEELGFGLYPNPVQDLLNITGEQQILSVSISNLLGQQVLELSPDSRQVEIDMSSLSTGVYLAKVRTAKGESIVKVVKE